MSIRNYLFLSLHKPQPTHAAGRFIGYLLTVLILSNCIAVALETVPSIYEPNKNLFALLEAISTGTFVIEYLCRLWVCVEQVRFSKPVIGRISYAIQPLQILDLIVIATFWAPYDFRFLRIFRITRLLRVLHLDEFDQSFQSISRAIGKRKHLLVVSVVAMLTVAYCFAALLYMVEHSAQPDKFSSIPETIWWAIVTLTTIGYGDITPITSLGKALCAGIVLIGIGVFTLPSAIVTAAILEAGTDRSSSCPHCGNQLD